MTTTFKKLLSYRDAVYAESAQVSSVLNYLHNALEQAQETKLQYNIDHARDRYTSYFNSYFYQSSDRCKDASDAISRHLDGISSRISKLLGES